MYFQVLLDGLLEHRKVVRMYIGVPLATLGGEANDGTAKLAVDVTIVGGTVFGNIPLIDEVTRALCGDAEPFLGHGQRVTGALAVYRDRDLVRDEGQDIPVLFGVAVASMIYLDSHDSDRAPLQL